MALQVRINGGVTMLPVSGLVESSGDSHRRSQRMGGRQPYLSGLVMAIKGGDGGGVDGSKKKAVPNSNYVVPMDNSFSSSYTSCIITRPLVEILRDLNKRIPEDIVRPSPFDHPSSSTFSIPWYHANRMLSFYAPGLCYILSICLIIVCTFLIIQQQTEPLESAT